MAHFSRKNIARLTELLEKRYKQDFESQARDASKFLIPWWLYIKSHRIRPLLSSYLVLSKLNIENFDDSIREMLGPYDEVEVEFGWINGAGMSAYAIPKDLAMKVLVLGDFPPV